MQIIEGDYFSGRLPADEELKSITLKDALACDTV